MTAQTGRTKVRWIRFCLDDSTGTPREIPINSLSAVGFVYEENDVTAWQDAVKGYLAGHPDAPIEISGPFDNSAAVALAASAAAPALSGSHTVLYNLAGAGTPLGLCVCFGIRHNWETGEPVFGVVAPSATSGYLCTSYTVEGETYSARFVPYPGTTPAWGTAILS